ncbi:MAG: PilW family protein [Pseudomonadota bacterium]
MNCRASQSGLSLIEVMIAVTLGLLILAGASSIFISSKQGFRVQDSTGRMQENTRYAMNYLSQILRSADFWSGVEPDFISVGPYAVSGPSGAKTCNGEWIVNVRDGLHGYEGSAKPPIDCITAKDYVAHSDMVAIRNVDPNTFTNAEDVALTANAKRHYVRTRVGANGYLYQGKSHSDADNHISSGDGVFNYEYDFQLLFLRPCSVKNGSTCSASDDNGKPIPTLVSLQLQTDGGVSQIALVDHVEQMQFEYGVDGDNDLVVDSYQKASAINDWRKVISVRASIIVRGDALDNFQDTKTYFMPSGFCYGPKSSSCAVKYTGYERYQRRLVVKDILIRNRIRQ